MFEALPDGLVPRRAHSAVWLWLVATLRRTAYKLPGIDVLLRQSRPTRLTSRLLSRLGMGRHVPIFDSDATTP